MKISIITATYNSGATLRDTLESVLRQDYMDYELIVKDGGSSDDTLSICREYEPLFEGRMRVVSAPDKGIYDAMNQGIAAATGEVVGILNSDDLYFDSGVLSTIASAFSKDNELECVYGDLVFVNANNIRKIERYWNGSQYREGDFLKGWAPAHPTFYAKRHCFEVYGSFNLDFEVSADFELMLRFIGKYGATNLYIPKKFVRMRLGGESTGSLKKIILGNRNILFALKINGYRVGYGYPLRRLMPKLLNILKVRALRILKWDSLPFV